MILAFVLELSSSLFALRALSLVDPRRLGFGCFQIRLRMNPWDAISIIASRVLSGEISLVLVDNPSRATAQGG